MELLPVLNVVVHVFIDMFDSVPDSSFTKVEPSLGAELLAGTPFCTACAVLCALLFSFSLSAVQLCPWLKSVSR